MLPINSLNFEIICYFHNQINKNKRFRRDSYDEDEYEIVCKHSNTGKSIKLGWIIVFQIEIKLIVLRFKNIHEKLSKYLNVIWIICGEVRYAWHSNGLLICLLQEFWVEKLPLKNVWYPYDKAMIAAQYSQS